MLSAEATLKCAPSHQMTENELKVSNWKAWCLWPVFFFHPLDHNHNWQGKRAHHTVEFNRTSSNGAGLLLNWLRSFLEFCTQLSGVGSKKKTDVINHPKMDLAVHNRWKRLEWLAMGGIARLNWGCNFGGQPPYMQDERTKQCQTSRITCRSLQEPPSQKGRKWKVCDLSDYAIRAIPSQFIEGKWHPRAY